MLTHSLASRSPDFESWLRRHNETQYRSRAGSGKSYGQLHDLTMAAQSLVAGHIASSTRTTYTAGFSRFHSYCSTVGLHSLPATPASVVNFLAHLRGSATSVSTARVYLAAITNAHREAGLPSPTTSDIVDLAMRGYQRFGPPEADKRLPLTVGLMRHLKNRIHDGGVGTN